MAVNDVVAVVVVAAATAADAGGGNWNVKMPFYEWGLHGRRMLLELT